MKRAGYIFAWSLIFWLGSVGQVTAGPDDYACDTVIYGGSTAAVNPNVLIILDTSLSMNDEVEVTASGGHGDDVERRAKIEIAKDVIDDTVKTASGVNLGLMQFHYNKNASREEDVAKGGEFVSFSGYTATIKDMAADYNPPKTNREKLREIIPEITAQGFTPLAESLYEAGRYFRGETSAFQKNVSHTSPIQATCQTNYVVLISDGMSRHDRHPVLAREIGDQDGDGYEPGGDSDKDYGSDNNNDPERLGSDYLDDVAKWLYDNDHSDLEGLQNVVTYTVGFGEVGADSGAVKLLNETIAKGTGGALNQAYFAMDLPDLNRVLQTIFAEIKKVNTSFAAPVIPASPQNRFASGERVYFGLFQPSENGRWKGNLKKYGINADGQILDKDLEEATDENGRIKEKATSFWSSTIDGDKVPAGGAGAILLERDFSSNHPEDGRRRIYSNLVYNSDLTHAFNALSIDNDSSLTAARLGVPGSERDKIINFVHGFDAYDDDADDDTFDKRSWILGDILHAAPVTVHYDDYAFTAENEADPAINKSVIFVAGNDGQLHAFRDADGKELWSFIPDVLLPDLESLRDGQHTYYVDMAPSVFIFDPGGNGPSDPGDQVILIFGLRRGAGKDTLRKNQVRGAYYALDVTTADAPKLLWRLLPGDVTGFEELGEAWSAPTFARMRVQENGIAKDMMVAVFGAGYDNNEDLRFGDTQGFPKTRNGTDTTLATNDAGHETSADNGAQHNPRGRGLFALKVGEFSFDSGPIFTPAWSVRKVWGYSNAENAAMSFGIPSEVAALDLNHDGYVDRFYVGDTGGQLWRVDAGSSNPEKWSVDLLFQADAGTHREKGRKFFYRPSVTVERNGQPMIFIGSGDRAHPLNEAVVDRLYAVKDPVGPLWDAATPLNEEDLADVTENTLQGEDAEAVQAKLSDLYSSHGWFIKLDQNSGEKALASPLVYNKAAYFTTFTPNVLDGNDPCETGNLGTARVYAVDYRSGEAVLNYDPRNDDNAEAITNIRALDNAGNVLRRPDRARAIGSGIPSEVKVFITETGEAKVMTASDGGIQMEDALPGGGVHPLYWLQR